MNFTCSHCNKNFERSKRLSYGTIHLNQKPYCSPKCSSDSRLKVVCVNCKQCSKVCQVQQHRKRENNFCSQSCAATYNNTHKTKGIRISKLEKWLQSQLLEKYPNLEFVFNGKEAINSELDIYIPSLKLAFELNGIFHYEPIYGQDKLDQIQNNDHRKFQACAEKGISLCIIDTSSQKKFTEKSSQKFLDIIQSILL